MPEPQDFLSGEFSRVLDDRFRLAIPRELGDLLAAESPECILAKERPGCLSLWSAAAWKGKMDEGIEWVKEKMRKGKLDDRVAQVQLFGRLLSTRHAPVSLAGRSRLVIPEGFREFLRVDRGGDVLVVGAAVCAEIWSPPAWAKYLETQIPKFRRLLERLSK